MGQSTPFAPTSSVPSFLVGQDEHGRWIVRDARGLVGGLFVDRQSALRFACFESDHEPNAVLFVPQHVGLTLSGPIPPMSRP